MPGLSKHRKKAKVEALKREEAKRAARSDTRAENEDLNTTELAEVIAKTKVKLGRKRLQKQEPDFVVTRQIAAVLEAKEKVKEQGRNRTQNFRAKVAENLEASKEKAKKRRGILEQTKKNIKVKKLEERNEELEEMIAAKNTNFSQPSSSSYQRLSIDTEDSLALTSAPLSPTEVMSFNFRTPESASPFLDVHESTKIKNALGISEGKYGMLRIELKKKGINMPSTSTIQRNEKKIFNEYFQHSEKPNFYGLIEKEVMKHDFSKLENVRITLGGDGGGDGDRSSVKIGCFFNDIELPLSVKKFIVIWSYVGKESWQLLKPVLEYVDEDVFRLQQNGIMTCNGLKPVIVTYTGDCKFQCSSLSLQGGSAVCGCPKCVAKRAEWPSIKSEDIVLRTIQSIILNAEQVVNNNKQPRMQGSVFNFPLLRNIPITHYVPPPVHILISLLTEIIAWIRKAKGENYEPLEEFLKQTRAKIHFPAKTYNGNESRKILHHFREENPKRIVYDGYGKELFQAASKIEELAVARTLIDEEIQSLENYINLFFNLVKDFGNDAIKFFLNKTKIHMLKEHVVPFVQMFKSWGLFSEQSVESIHHIRNDLDDRVPGAGPKIDMKRNNLFLKNQAVTLHYNHA